MSKQSLKGQRQDPKSKTKLSPKTQETKVQKAQGTHEGRGRNEGSQEATNSGFLVSGRVRPARLFPASLLSLGEMLSGSLSQRILVVTVRPNTNLTNAEETGRGDT